MMNVNFEIIINVFLAMFLYNMVLKSIANVLIKHFLENNKAVQDQKKTFREKLEEKLKENKQ